MRKKVNSDCCKNQSVLLNRNFFRCLWMRYTLTTKCYNSIWQIQRSVASVWSNCFCQHWIWPMWPGRELSAALMEPVNVSDHLYWALSSIHHPTVWQGHRQGRCCSAQNHHLVCGVIIDIWNWKKKNLIGTWLKIARFWIQSPDLDPQTTQVSHPENPPDQNNSFLLDYHADKTQADTVCHAGLRCWLTGLAHNEQHSGAGAERAATVAQNTVSDWLTAPRMAAPSTSVASGARRNKKLSYSL